MSRAPIRGRVMVGLDMNTMKSLSNLSSLCGGDAEHLFQRRVGDICRALRDGREVSLSVSVKLRPPEDNAAAPPGMLGYDGECNVSLTTRSGAKKRHCTLYLPGAEPSLFDDLDKAMEPGA